MPRYATWLAWRRRSRKRWPTSRSARARPPRTMARAHARTPQMGRAHGQHAVPMTFGYAVALYVPRIGQRIESIVTTAQDLHRKFAGAVGAYHALSLLSKKPAEVEAAL